MRASCQKGTANAGARWMSCIRKRPVVFESKIWYDGRKDVAGQNISLSWRSEDTAIFGCAMTSTRGSHWARLKPMTGSFLGCFEQPGSFGVAQTGGS